MVNSIHATNVVVARVLPSAEILHQADYSKPVDTFAPINSNLEVVVVSTVHFEIGNLDSSNIMFFADFNVKEEVNYKVPNTTFANNHVAMVVLDFIDVQNVVVNLQKVVEEIFISLVM